MRRRGECTMMRWWWRRPRQNTREQNGSRRRITRKGRKGRTSSTEGIASNMSSCLRGSRRGFLCNSHVQLQEWVLEGHAMLVLFSDRRRWWQRSRLERLPHDLLRNKRLIGPWNWNVNRERRASYRRVVISGSFGGYLAFAVIVNAWSIQSGRPSSGAQNGLNYRAAYIWII